MKRLLEQNTEKEKEIYINPADEIDVENEFVNENLNKLNKKTSTGVDVIDISGVDNAIDQLTIMDEDKHPEKRMKAVNILFYFNY
jgi:hypothetical protein